MKNYLLTHFDLDGVGCYIALSQLIEFEKVYTSTYNEKQIQKCFSEVVHVGYFPVENTLYVTDLNLEQKYIDDICINKLVYIDHHPGSEELIFNRKNAILAQRESITIIDQKYAASKLCMNYVESLGADISKIKKLINLIDHFDMHRFAGDKDLTSVYLNELFWELKFEEFYSIYKNGFTKENIKYLALGKKIFENKLEQTKKEELLVQDDICVCFEVSSLLYLDFLYHDKLNYYLCCYHPNKCSIRSKYNLQPFYDRINEEFKSIIVSCGGHKGAGSITFNKKIDSDIIEKMVNIMEEVK